MTKKLSPKEQRGELNRDLARLERQKNEYNRSNSIPLQNFIERKR